MTVYEGRGSKTYIMLIAYETSNKQFIMKNMFSMDKYVNALLFLNIRVQMYATEYIFFENF